MAGPLPTPNPRRRNAATIPTTKLPASGRSDLAPDVPPWMDLGPAGRAWWDWAWTTPQACAWADGHEVVAARRAQLEDDMSALSEVEGLDLVAVADAESDTDAKNMIRRVASMATGRLQIMKHMLDLDDRLGLTPKGMAALRWSIVADEPAKQETQKSNVRRLKAVDPRAVAGA